MIDALIYDVEIAKAVQSHHEFLIDGVEYCNGWKDLAGMGIACVCAYDYVEDRYRTFFKDNMREFNGLLLNRRMIVGFNSVKFDNELLLYDQATSNTSLALRSYDILREIWIALGLDPNVYEETTHGGYGLDDVCKANFFITKSGHGAQAPVDYQRGNYGSLVDYCLNDVRLTKRLFDHILENGYIVNPRDTGRIIRVKRPRL